MKSLIDIVDMSVEEIDELISVADDIMANPEKYSEKCKGKKLATLFFEPSTRTRLSFEAAMLELGGGVIGFSSAASSSAAKGESYADTAKVVSKYADIIAIRTPVEGASLVCALNSDVPVINAGDGGHKHPTQTLADLMTIKKEKGGFENITVGFCGDLKYGRTVHSLIGALSRYKGFKAVLISPGELKLPDYVRRDVLDKNSIEYVETPELGKVIGGLDALYMTRIQRERFSDPAEYDRLKDSYILTVDKLEKAGKNTIVMHPLPRVNEISVKVDNDPRACYFKQVLYGKYIRMALILKLLKDAKTDGRPFALKRENYVYGKYACVNPKCVCRSEQELENIAFASADGIMRCAYCEKQVK